MKSCFLVCYLVVTFVLIYQASSQHDMPMHTMLEEPELLPGAIFQSSPHVTQVEQDLSHECVRDCSKDLQRKKCHYKFKPEWYISMSKACYDCPYNLTDCFRPHCVVLDGRQRPIVTVNRRLPGPSIQVCEEDEVIVDLDNELMSDSTSIHWHGVHQYGTPYMDGVPFLTQCPIHAGTLFRYHFIAKPAGTHFWHSHSGFQRDDGIFGSLIVRSRNDSYTNLYDVDDPEHVILLTDWFDSLTINKFVNHYRAAHGNKPYNLLVNGLGKYSPFQKGNQAVYAPMYEFRVEQGVRYRFRSIHNSIQSCPIEISVDNHTLLVIASDGQNIEPLEVESLVIFGGERWDFVINANQTPAVYWMKFRGQLECDTAYQVAALRYEGATGFPDEPKDVNYNFTKREGLQLNKVNAAPGDQTNFYTTADLRSVNLIEEPSPYARTPDHKFWLYFDFYTRSNDYFHRQDFYPQGVEQSQRLALPQINNISLKLPDVSLLSQTDEVNQTMFCNETTRTNCDREFCHCTHILNVELGSLVELILVDTGVAQYNSHPFHIHGHSLAVLGMGRLGESTTLQAVQDLDREGRLQRNLVNPPLRDSFVIPDGGYTVVRFIANNPGYWLFHCHLSFHFEVGMGMILHVGEKKDLPSLPPGFPKCGFWVPKPVDDLQANINNWKNSSRDL